MLTALILTLCSAPSTAAPAAAPLSLPAASVPAFQDDEEIQDKRPSEWFLSWSFSLACTAFVLNQIAASILVTENKRLHQQPEGRYYPNGLRYEGSSEQATPLVQGFSEELKHVWSHKT